MRIRLFKIQLWILFALSLGALFFFAYQGELPDNMFSISSDSDSLNWFTYGLSSLVALIGYYVGSWVLLLFLSFVPLYVLIFARRSFWIDHLFNLLGLAFFVSLSYLFIPSLIGGAFLYVLSSLRDWIFWCALPLSFFAIIWLITRENFVPFCRQCIWSVARLFLSISSVKKLFKKSYFHINWNFSGWNFKTWLRSKMESFLKGKQKSWQGQTHTSSTSSYIEEEEIVENKIDEDDDLKSVVNKVVEEKNRIAQEAISAVPTNELETDPEPEVLVEQPAPAMRKLSKKPSSGAIKSKDLINCLVSNKVQPTAKPDDDYFQDIITCLEKKLTEFGINARVINVLKGPVVDTFELELGAGVKVSKVTGMHEDLSLALSGVPIRMVHPMPGRTTIGVEVPRNPREIIYLDEVLSSKKFLAANHHLPIAMGKNAFGEITVVDLAKMPHMLVAGATGSGKSVFVNTLLVSLLVKLPPSKMRLILVDPKQLELALYSKLPHLILPVVTEAKMASASLLWAVQEMERRYTILKEMRVRNIEGFNQKVVNASDAELAKIAHLYDDEADGYELPYIVVIVDEFADLILTKMGKEIENNICRLAAKARASGIHLVIATQRPSVDVITGLIKSNFPTRVSFRVSSAVDSRTILNTMGGEKLLGHGDMLYKYGVDMTRVHGSYVDEREIEVLMDRLCDDEPKFNQAALDFIESGGQGTENGDVSISFGFSDDEGGVDPLFDDAVRVVQEYGQASASMLQRRMRVGYNRAANLIELMEARGIVGPQQGSKPREVLSGKDPQEGP